jgi:hypothetical protein
MNQPFSGATIPSSPRRITPPRLNLSRSRCPVGPSRLGTREPLPVAPTCRLRLEGREAQEGACDLLELSAEGVTVAIREGRAPRQGDHGHLLIGPAEGSHYVLPVAVRWVKPSTTASILGLVFPEAERWTYNCA